MPKKAMPKYLLRLKYPHWCSVVTTDYSNPSLPLTDEGNPNWEMYSPFGMDGDKPKRVPCREVIIYQATPNPNTLYPADVNGLNRVVHVYLPLILAESELKRLYRQSGWSITVYHQNNDPAELGNTYTTSCAASIYTENNPHIEFVCIPT